MGEFSANYVDNKNARCSAKDSTCGCQGLPVPTATRWGISAGCAQATHRSTGRSPRNPQAVGTTDPQPGHAKVKNNTGVMPGGGNPPASVGRCPRHANEEMFGMADTTTPRHPQARPGSPERPADRSTARRWLATCRRILENSQGR